LMAIKSVSDEDDLMIITKAGITIRMHMDVIRVMGRAAQGVRLINLKGNAAIAAVANVPRDEDEEVVAEIDGEIIEGEIDADLEDDATDSAENEDGTDIENEDENDHE